METCSRTEKCAAASRPAGYPATGPSAADASITAARLASNSSALSQLANGIISAKFDDSGSFTETPVKTDFGFHVIKVEGVREGDVPVEEAKKEIAEQLYEEEVAGDLAKAAAEDALSKLKGGMSLEDLDGLLAGMPASEAGEEETPEENPLRPKVEESRAFGRSDSPISGPFDSTPLARNAFELTEEDPLGKEVLALGKDFFIYRLEEKTLATKDEFDDEVKERIRAGLTRAKQQEVIQLYTDSLRRKAERAERIRINDAILSYETGSEPGQS